MNLISVIFALREGYSPRVLVLPKVYAAVAFHRIHAVLPEGALSSERYDTDRAN